MHKSFLLILLFSPGLSVLLPDTAQANTGSAIALKSSVPDVSGTWNVSAGDGRKATFSFTQNGNKLRGIMRGLPFGDLPVSGTVTNSGRVSFAGKVRGMKLTFTGTVSGATMSGTADMPMGRKGGWTATR
jgi:hypothetical protein